MALHTLAGIETARAPSYMKMYWNVIEAHEYALQNDNLSTNYLVPEDIVNNESGKIIDKDDYNRYLAGEISEVDFKIIGGYNGWYMWLS